MLYLCNNNWKTSKQNRCIGWRQFHRIFVLDSKKIHRIYREVEQKVFFFIKQFTAVHWSIFKLVYEANTKNIICIACAKINIFLIIFFPHFLCFLRHQYRIIFTFFQIFWVIVVFQSWKIGPDDWKSRRKLFKIDFLFLNLLRIQAGLKC